MTSRSRFAEMSDDDLRHLAEALRNSEDMTGRGLYLEVVLEQAHREGHPETPDRR
jgi:hypothetical protein